MRRVAWVRVGALGDLLVGLAGLEEALSKWPEHRFSIVGSKLWLEILEPGRFPQIDRLVLVPKRENQAEVFALAKNAEGHPEWKPQGASTLYREYRQCDVLFNTRVDSPRQAIPALFARVGERWGAAAGMASWVYNHRAPHDGKDPLIHERDVPLLLMDEAEESDKTGTRGNLRSLEERQRLSRRINSWRGRGLPCPRTILDTDIERVVGCNRGHYALVNPTSSRREKAWPSEKYRQLVQALRLRAADSKDGNPYEILVIGSPTETAWLEEVAREADVRVLQPQNIGDLFCAVAGARWLLSNTSSVQFIAASVQTRVLTLMGVADPRIWGPLGAHDRWIRGSDYLKTEIADLFERERKAYEVIPVDRVIEELRKIEG